MKNCFKSSDYSTFDDFLSSIENYILFTNIEEILNLDPDLFIFTLKELLNNSIKSLSKRVFFERNGADIFDKECYENLTPLFLQERNHITNEDHKQHGYFTFLDINQFENRVVFTVFSNSQITQEELENIQCIINADTDVIPPHPEGASMGLISVKRFLEFSELPQNALNIMVSKNTLFTLTIPIKTISDDTDKENSDCHISANSIPKEKIDSKEDDYNKQNYLQVKAN